MYEPKFLEVNPLPSQLNTATSSKGALSQLANQLENKPNFDNQTIEGMRNNPLYSRHDKIDKIGLAQKQVADAANALCKSKFVREMNRKMNHPNKPSLKI